MRRSAKISCITASVMLLIGNGFSQKLQDSTLDCHIFERTVKCKKYIEQYYYEAVKQMLIYGIPASITLAQGILESGMGESELAINSNNHFGIKCQNTWPGAVYIHDDDQEDECFRKYSSPIESYSDHSKFLRFRPRYSFLFNLKITDYVNWAKGLKLAGYATDPQYAEKLIGIIKQNSLNLYDSIGYLLNLSSLPNKYTAVDSAIASGKMDIYSLVNKIKINEDTLVKKAEARTDQYLEFTGKVRDRKKGKGRPAKVYVYKDNNLCSTYRTSSSGKCKIKLPLNEKYTLVFSEEGFLSKKVYIDTRVPCINDTVYKFNYTVYLFEEIKKLKLSVFNEPVAIISLSETNKFDYDYYHSSIINKKAEEIYYNYYLLADK